MKEVIEELAHGFGTTALAEHFLGRAKSVHFEQPRFLIKTTVTPNEDQLRGRKFLGELDRALRATTADIHHKGVDLFDLVRQALKERVDFATNAILILRFASIIVVRTFFARDFLHGPLVAFGVGKHDRFVSVQLMHPRENAIDRVVGHESCGRHLGSPCWGG